MSVPPSTPNPSDPNRTSVPASGTRRRRSSVPVTPTQVTPSSRYAVPQQPIDPNHSGQPPYYPPAGQAPPPGYYYPPAMPGQVPNPPTATQRGTDRRRARDRRESGLYLPWWSLLVMLVVVGGIGVGALLVVSTVGGQAPAGGTTPVFVVITATYTIGPPASATPIPQIATDTPPPPLPTLAPSASLPPGNFTIGATVQVIGTGDAGLNVRTGPGTTNPRSFLAHDGDKFVLKEGPQDSDGVEWWHITDPNNPNNDGWASRQFLTATGP